MTRTIIELVVFAVVLGALCVAGYRLDRREW